MEEGREEQESITLHFQSSGSTTAVWAQQNGLGCLGLVTLPYPGGVRRCHLQAGTFPKESCSKAMQESKSTKGGLVTGRVCSLPAWKPLLCRARLQTKGDGARRWQWWQSENALSWTGQHLAVTSAANRNKNVQESSYLPQTASSQAAVEDTMNVLHRYKKPHSFCYNWTKDTRVTFREHIFKNIFHNF